MNRLVLLVILILALWATPVLAANTINFAFAGDTLSAVKVLFQSQPNCNYAISAGITGTVDVNLTNVTFEAALSTLTKSGNIVVLFDGKTYFVGPKPVVVVLPVVMSQNEDTTTVAPTVVIQVVKISLYNMSPSELLSILSGSVGKGQSANNQYPWNQPWNQSLGRNNYQQYPALRQTPLQPTPLENPTPNQSLPTQPPVQTPANPSPPVN